MFHVLSQFAHCDDECSAGVSVKLNLSVVNPKISEHKKRGMGAFEIY